MRDIFPRVFESMELPNFKGGFTPFFALGDQPIPFGIEKYKLYLISSEKIGRSPGFKFCEKNQFS